MDAEAKGLTVEDLTLGQAPSPEALVARFVGEGILHLAEDGTLWRLKRKVGGHRGPRYQSVRPERADREMPMAWFNPGKQSEYRERKHFVESACPRDLCE